MVALERVLPEADQARDERELAAAGKARARHGGTGDDAQLRALVERHLRFTGSTVALALLDDWDAARAKFVKVFPNEYKRALTELAAKPAGATGEAKERAAA
jgi:glutamate synthase (NADPH) large chain